jgi:serine/threonine protein kinase
LTKVFALKRYRFQDKPLFEREQRALSLLKGATGVVQAYGSFQDRESFNMILEYASMDLEKYFDTAARPTNSNGINQLWCSLLQLLKGLSIIHNLGIDQIRYSG